MGGPMNVNDLNEYPWLRDEKTFLRACIEQMLTHCADELTDGPFIQSPEHIHAGCGHQVPMRQVLWRLLDGFFETT